MQGIVVRLAFLFSIAAFIGNPSWAQPLDRSTAEGRARALVAQMTANEKLTQMSNSMAAIPRLGVRAYELWNEGLHGASVNEAATIFPQAIGMAATFDPAEITRMGEIVADEMTAVHRRAVARGQHTGAWIGLNIWSPNINIFRDPRWGRGQETYGEDPFLTARMGVAYITGAQGPEPDRPRVIATPKHFAVHSGPEPSRHQDDVTVSLHDLEDTYLPAFRAAITEAKAGSVMCAYNRINGQPACANDFLLKERLRGSWGFQGFVVSDCDSVDDIAAKHKYVSSQAEAAAVALKAGTDSDCSITDIVGLDDVRKRYTAAYEQKLISDADIDLALVRVFTARYQLGVVDARASKGTAPVRVPKPEHRAAARRAAEKSLVLLKNNGVLPLAVAPKRIAVVGPLAYSERVLYANYSSGINENLVTAAEGIRAAFPGAYVDVPASEALEGDADTVPSSVLRSEDGQPGLTARYFAQEPSNVGTERYASLKDLLVARTKARFVDKPYRTGVEPTVDLRRWGGFDNNLLRERVTWTGFLVPNESGTYLLGLQGSRATARFDGKPLSVPKQVFGTGDLELVELQKGRRYPVEISDQIVGGTLMTKFAWKRLSLAPVDDAVKAAQAADLVVAVVGITSDLESEESTLEKPGFLKGDRTSLDLPESQLKLLEAIKATGKKLVVVSMSGSALNLAWAQEHADAVIQAWYPGEEGGNAIGEVMAGRVNPAGRLPVTFYKNVSQLPPFGDYSMKERTYRYFTGTPLYPFGYGLSYTRFTYGKLIVTPVDGDPAHGLHVRTTVSNAGARDGDEVAQLYLRFPDRPGTPRLALRGFQRISVPRGETRSFEFTLSPRDLSSVSLEGRHAVIAGNYRLSVGGGQPSYTQTSDASFEVKSERLLPY
jgi:beta-glucosidase